MSLLGRIERSRTPHWNILPEIVQVLKEANKPLSTAEIAAGLVKIDKRIEDERMASRAIEDTLQSQTERTYDRRLPQVIEVVRRVYALHYMIDRLTFADTAELVLIHDRDKLPRDYEEILDRVSQYERLPRPVGKTPVETLRRAIRHDIASAEACALQPRFLLKDGKVGLTRWELSDQGDILDRRNVQLRRDLLSRVKGLNQDRFELLMIRLFERMGYLDVESYVRNESGGTRPSRQKNQINTTLRAIWQVAGMMNKRVLIFLSREDDDISEEAVHMIQHDMRHNLLSRPYGMIGIIVTMADFEVPAIMEAQNDRDHAVVLINGQTLLDLLIKHGVGVKRFDTYEITDFDLDEIR